MQKIMLRASALLLSLLLAGAPSLADYCAVSCATAHIRDGSASSPHTGHHHHSSTASSIALHTIDQAPQPCGHDHNGIPAVTASADAAHTRPLTTASAAVLPAIVPAASLWTSASDFHSSTSPPSPSVRGFASPIRV
jgi:hypothetical protein